MHGPRQPQHGAHGVQVVDHAAGQQAEGALHLRGGVADRLPDGNPARGCGLLDCGGGIVVEPAQLELPQVEPVIRMQMVHLHETDSVHLPRRPLRQLEGGIVHLHVAGLGDRTSGTLGIDHGIDLRQRKTQRLFDEQVLAGLQDGDGGLGLGVGVTQQDRVQVRRQQLPVVGEVARHVEAARGVRGGAR